MSCPFIPPFATLRTFAAVVIAAAVSTLQDWCHAWPTFHARGATWQRERLKAARQCDEWFLETADPPDDKLGFRELADVLGIDPDVFVERLYSGLDAEAVLALWTLPEAVETRGRRKTTAPVRSGDTIDPASDP